MTVARLVKSIFASICALSSRCSIMRQNWRSYCLPKPRIHSVGYRNSVIVIDASPSMEKTDWYPSRLGAAKESAQAFIWRLLQQDPSARVAVVTYSTQAYIVAGLTPIRRYSDALNATTFIAMGNFTNIRSGLKAAYSILRFHKGDNQVILLSDGFHNFGLGPRRIADKLKEIAIIETVGIAGTPETVDAKTLKYCASARADGTKRYRWIGHKEALVQHFEDLAGGLTRA